MTRLEAYNLLNRVYYHLLAMAGDTWEARETVAHLIVKLTPGEGKTAASLSVSKTEHGGSSPSPLATPSEVLQAELEPLPEED